MINYELSSLKDRILEHEFNRCSEFLALFKLEGRPVNEIVTEGQMEIFHALIYRPSTRLQILCSTQYGKSLFVALACLIITCVQKKVVAVVAPSTEKAKIIMRYYIQHLGDSPNFVACLEKETKLDRLRQEESKERIMLNNGGGIFVLSANASNSQKGIEAAMGAGSEIVITDESSLIPDPIEATIFRMIAGKGKDAFYCKIGNPFYRNHFLASWADASYDKIFIDYDRGLKEGRYNSSFIEEAKKKPHFEVLFGCLFPDEDAVDDKGYIALFSSKVLDEAQKRVVVPFGERRLGVDIAEGGGDYNAFVLKTKNFMRILKKFKQPNTMLTAGEVKLTCDDYEIVDRNVFLDTIGVGKGVYDKLQEDKWMCTSVKFSESPEREYASEEFYNMRAQCYWEFSKWLREGGTLAPSFDWQQLLLIKYKTVRGKVLIKPKKEIRKEIGYSPDVPDAAASVFARAAAAIITKSTLDRVEEKETLKQFDAFRRSSPSHNKAITGSAYLRNKMR